MTAKQSSGGDWTAADGNDQALWPSEETPEPGAQVYVASQWQLMWWRFRKHRLAMIGGIVVLSLYAIAILSPFLAPYGPDQYDAAQSYRPPSRIRFVDEQGRMHSRPFVYEVSQIRDPISYRLRYVDDTSIRHPIRFFVRGTSYRLLGLFRSDVHLFGLGDTGGRLHVFGADSQGRDVLSRILVGSQLSLSIGLVGVFLSFCLGLLLGGISGYFGGAIDLVIQRIIEFLRAMPTIPLWLSLSAAIPAHWPVARVYLAITVILSLIGWTGLARVVRGRFLSLREDEFVLAAQLDGCGTMNVIFRQMVPSFASHIIASLTLAIPAMILSETSLSFLGLGLRYPAVSWGVLLQEAQNIRSLAQAPWLLIPGLAVVVAVLSMNFLGDGLRDAADPYSR